MTTKLVEFDVGDGQTVLIEVEDVPSKGVKPVAIAPGEIAAKAKQSFEDSLQTIAPTVNAIHRRLSNLTQPADEVEVKFSVKLSGEVGAVVTKLGGEANYEITLKWKGDRAT